MGHIGSKLYVREPQKLLFETLENHKLCFFQFATCSCMQEEREARTMTM
jgi:hypothetical protein